MFFIGIFGIENKEKEIKIINNLTCKSCNRLSMARVIKQYEFFHFFFIPIFKWNEKYYVECESCKKIFSISKEKGKMIEKGENIDITYWDLNEVNSTYGYDYNINSVCKSCGKVVDSEYKYCPYCGHEIK
ncbi:MULTISPECIES: zinc-ribbon domain-containing protein [unclassified Clostridium]|uniref:zinc-ribbon domain-containing protein n=1 Tax=unclassified Clostridium TaxID=2614128 RepID=UPI001896D965|nr:MULTISPECIES: zinc-ribbon domain-containing protein [unclassified Clostridium]